MEVKVNFKAGGSFVKQQPQFTANSESVCVAWKNQILCYSAKTGQLQATYKGINSHIVGFSVHHVDAFECITACSAKGELVTWKVSTHFKLLKKRLNYKIVKSFHLIPSKSEKLEALVAYQEQDAVHFALYNINTDSSEDYRITLDNLPFIIVCSDKYFVVAQMNRVNYMKLNNFTKVFVHMIEKIRTFTCLACHPDEEKVLAGDTGGRVVLFENIFALKQTQAVFHWHTLPVKCVAFSNAGSYFYSGGDESVLVRWQVDNHLEKKFLPRLPASIERISVSNGNVHVAVATGDNAIRIVNSQFDKVSLIQHLVIGNHFDSGIIIDPRTKALVMNGNVGHVQFYSPFDGNLLYSVDVVGQNKITNERGCNMENTQVIKMAISKSGLWMATVEVREDAEYSSGYENRLKFWYFDLEKQTFKLNTCVEYPHEKKITAIQFQPCKHEDELKCATVGDDGKFKIWQISDATDIYNLSKIWQCSTTGYYGDLPCKGLSFSTDGSLIAVGFNENLTAWLPDSCHLKFSLVHAKFKEPITQVLFGSIRQSHLLAAASEKRLMIWNILTLSMTWTVPLAVSLLISDPISSNMAVITHDKKLFVFCPSKPEPIYQSDKLLKSRSEVYTAAFVPTKNSNDVRLDWYQRSSIFLIDAKRELFSIGTDETETTQNAYVDEVSSTFYSKMLPQTATNKAQSVEPSQHLFTSSINTIQQFLEGPIQTMAPIRIICRSIVESLILKTKSEPVEIINGDNGNIETRVPIQNGHINSSDGSNDDADKKDDDSKNKDEVVFIQEVGFSVKIVSPGSEPFDVQVTSMELVQEMHQLLMDREDTCHRTCFSLQLDGNTLDNFAEVKNIEGLKEGSVIKVVEEPYTMREARIHVRHVRDLLKSLDPADAYNGVECNSLSFLNIVTQGDILEKKKVRPESVDCTPPDYIMPDSKDRPLTALQPQMKDHKVLQCVKILTTSAWNPPPGYRKIHGDLMYLYVVTLEDKHYHISACSRGFYINQCTAEEFNPKAATPSHLCHSLIELLNQISPQFKRNFATLQKKRSQRHPFERVATPYQLYAWCAPQMEHTVDAIRAEDTFSSKLGYEEHIPGQTRDWNEELQTTRELPRNSLPERLLRERAIFKVHSDFVAAATRGAMAVIDGNVMAINPGEETKMQMFIWNNIFFSLGFDVRDHYKELGGDAAAFVAPRNDLQGVKVYSAVDLPGLYTLGTVVIDYRGYRVTAQSIIPGILEREQEQSVVYGSIDFGKTVLSHPKYLELLKKAGEQLKILPHHVLNDQNEPIELCSSVECKGIIGNDGRHYILDLLRTFPPDVNFSGLDDEVDNEMKKWGFPIKHKHKLCCLRQELIDSYYDSKYLQFIKYAAFYIQKLNLRAGNLKINNNQQIEGTKVETDEAAEERTEPVDTANGKISSEKEAKDSRFDEEAKKIVESVTDKSKLEMVEESTREILKLSAKFVRSLKDGEFDIRFNPDVYSPGIKHCDDLDPSIDRQRALVRDASAHLVIIQIPSFIRDCLDHSSSPMDGVTLAEAMHTRGINMRYLGKVATELKHICKLEYLRNIAVSELILRSAKHIFTVYLQGCEMLNLSVAIAHFLNCLLYSGAVANPLQGLDETKNSKKRNKRRGKPNPLACNDNNEWATLTPKTLWVQLKQEMKSYYDYEIPTNDVESTIEMYCLQKVSLLRSFCLKTGIQIMLRDYNFDSKSKVIFYEEDILNIFPIVKHINPRATDAYNFYTTGQNKIQQGYLKDGYELISEALNLLNNVYGAMHPEISQCLRMIARLNYIMGEHAEAMAYQQKAVLMSERVNGIDHPYTITEYVHLALYCFANSQVSTALKLLYRARYLATIVCGENHPEIALLDSNISLILHAVGEYELSLRFLQKALDLNTKYYGKPTLKVAVSYHLVARTQSCMGNFRAALSNEKEAYAIYRETLGEEHEKTRESSECLKHLTQQAVVLQKKINEIHTGKNGASLPPIQIQPPSMGSVLDMLNVINGILFVQISQEDIENFKAEIEKRQLSEEAEQASEQQAEKEKPAIDATAAK